MSADALMSQRVHLSQSLTLREARAVHTQLLEALASAEITIVAKDLTRVDAIGVQLVVCFALEAERRGARVVIQDGDVLLDAARTLGLAETLSRVAKVSAAGPDEALAREEPS